MAIEYSVLDAAGCRSYQDGMRITYSNWKYVLTVLCLQEIFRKMLSGNIS
jgi:hypothetical protein